MKTVLRSLACASLALVPLAACNQAAAPAPQASVPTVTPSTFRMPEATGCEGEVERYRAVMENDRRMGQVNMPVYNQVAKEIDQATAACSAGRDAQAITLVRASKARHGYR